jgi:2-desacetyl-2-hydroxyethyl bacteriochlorophyllide A dehydrogenase
MQAQALICEAGQTFSIQAVTLPDPLPQQVVIRTACSGVSIGTEFALIRNKISWGPYPLCTGYMATGVIEAVGSAVKDFTVGDRVFCRGNSAMHLGDGRAVSAVSGTHCSHVVTDVAGTHGVEHLPSDAPMDVTAMFVMPAVGLCGVDMANPRTGQRVVVSGCGLIGLGVIAACAQRGCVVIAIDVNPATLTLARTFGADHCIDARQGDAAVHVQSLTKGGADVVFECTGLPQCLDPAIAMCRSYGTFVWQGNYGAAPIQMHFLPAHERRLTMLFPCDDGGPAFRRAVIKNMASGVLPWSATVTHRCRYEQAPELYSRINRGEGGVIGALIEWPT